MATKTNTKTHSKGSPANRAKVEKHPLKKGPQFSQICRPDSKVGLLLAALKDGKVHNTETIFPKLQSGDPGQILTDLRRLGKSKKLFEVQRVGQGQLQLIAKAA